MKNVTPCTSGTMVLFVDGETRRLVPVEAWDEDGSPLVAAAAERALVPADLADYGTFASLVPGGAVEVTIVTRHGRPAVAIAPISLLPREQTMTATATDIVVTLDRSGADDGWNWAEVALG